MENADARDVAAGRRGTSSIGKEGGVYSDMIVVSLKKYCRRPKPEAVGVSIFSKHDFCVYLVQYLLLRPHSFIRNIK